MGKYFGTDGFRGEANVTLTAEKAFKVGRYLGWYYGQNQAANRDKKARIVIGRDTRLSGQMLEASLTAGLTASGADVYLLNVTTTPSVSYVVRTGAFDCGIMISASHNVYTDNGIKIITGAGKKTGPEFEEKIEAYIDGKIPELKSASGADIGTVISYEEGRDLYVKSLLSAADFSLEGVKIGLDCANGSTSDIAAPIFEKLGAEVHVIHNEPDGSNINRGCGSTHIEELQGFVIREHLDAGFAFDGDADRCMAVGEDGRIIDGDLILFICGKYLKEKGRLKGDTVVTTVMSNIGLYKALEACGISYEQTPVGDKNVYEAMIKNGYVLGGEQSGHVIFSEYATTGDGILTALMLLGVMREEKKGLSELAAPVTIYPQVLKNVRVKDKESAMENEAVLAAVSSAEKDLGSEGRILVRMSGTEPLIRVMAEAVTDEICEKHVDDIISVMEEQNLTA